MLSSTVFCILTRCDLFSLSNTTEAIDILLVIVIVFFVGLEVVENRMSDFKQ